MTEHLERRPFDPEAARARAGDALDEDSMADTDPLRIFLERPALTEAERRKWEKDA